ncbi:MAG: hypothetical protein RJB39_213 [Candidatus Parcubacteria bacterium]|jgi:peptide deformylase
MTQLAIVEKGDPILETPAKALTLAQIKSAPIQKLIADMKETLDAISDGVGLAAPQVGHGVRIFLVAKRVLARKKAGAGEVIDLNALKNIQDLVCINPKIVKASKTKKWMSGEGCLSVRWYYGKVYRSTHVTLEYTDEHGEKHTRGAGGLLAHIFQHECDHLEGHLFIDKAKEVEWLEPEEEGK